MKFKKYLITEAVNKVGDKVTYKDKPATIIKKYDYEKAGNIDTVFDIKLKNGKIIKAVDGHELTVK